MKRSKTKRKQNKLRIYLNKEFPDMLKEQLEKEDRMDVDPAELVMLNEDVEPHYSG